MTPRVSLTMIVKNEEANLPACLESVAGLVAEMIVVDTGSTDRTKQVALHYGAKVFDFPWCDDFAAARNAGLEHAGGDWVFWLDADDRLDEENRRRLAELLAALGDENIAWMMKCLCVSDPVSGAAQALDHARLFRNLPQIRWWYRVHEQIIPSVLAAGGKQRWSDVAIQHTGYQDPALVRHKNEYYLRLSELQYRERPDDHITLFNLGLMYQRLGRPSDAVPLLRRSLEQSRPSDPFSHVQEAYVALARALWQLGQTDGALATYREGRAKFPDAVKLLFEEAAALQELRDFAGAEARLRQLLQRPSQGVKPIADVRLCGYLARHRLAMIYRQQNRLPEAVAQLQQIVSEQPDFIPAWVMLADLYAAADRRQELEEMLARLQADPRRAVEAALVRARWQMARQQFAAARQDAETAIALAPRALWPRVALSHVLLLEGRDWAAAERALLDVLALAPGDIDALKNLSVLRERFGRSKA